MHEDFWSKKLGRPVQEDFELEVLHRLLQIDSAELESGERCFEVSSRAFSISKMREVMIAVRIQHGDRFGRLWQRSSSRVATYGASGSEIFW
eukprot:m.274416 g.274416  ORF g.274416 m.274416 type:complete len:92 (-) comp22857_c1_seq20:853-1128(-)